MREFYSFFAAVVMAASFNAQVQTIVSENIGTTNASGNPVVSSYNGFQNSGTLTFDGTADVRSSAVSTGYTGASGGNNVFFAAAGGRTFIIKGINTSGYNAETITLSFGHSSTKSSSVTIYPVVALEVSTDDGETWESLTVQPNTSTAWTLKSGITGIPASSNLTLKFTAPVSASGLRVDDIIISGEPASAATPVLNVDAEAVEFPQTEVDKTSVENVTVTAENLTEDITYTVSGADADDFTIAGELTAEGGSLEVTFAPTAVGVKTAVLTITSGDLTKTVNLSGEAVAAGTLAVSNASATKVVLVKNTVATDELIFAQEAQVTLVNMNGQIVKNAKVSNGTALNVSALPNGIYLVTAVVNGKPVSQKIIKK